MRLDDCTLGSHDGYIYIITMYQYIYIYIYIYISVTLLHLCSANIKLLCVRYTSIIHYRTA